MTPKEILEIQMETNDAGAVTIRHYLHELLATLWEQEESFSGKRPFGNSGWQYEVTNALEAAGVPESEWHDSIYAAIDYALFPSKAEEEVK